jgi:hypothetical protein
LILGHITEAYRNPEEEIVGNLRLRWEDDIKIDPKVRY